MRGDGERKIDHFHCGLNVCDNVSDSVSSKFYLISKLEFYYTFWTRELWNIDVLIFFISKEWYMEKPKKSDTFSTPKKIDKQKRFDARKDWHLLELESLS